MAFKVTTLTSLLILALASLLSTVLTVSAQGTGIGTPNPGTPISSTVRGIVAMHLGWNCKDRFYGCQNLKSATCCTINQPFWPGPNSFTVWSPTGGHLYTRTTNYRAFSDTACLGWIYDGKPGTCMQGKGPYFSGKWYEVQGKVGASSAEIEREMNITTSITEAGNRAANCATADVYGFIEGGKPVTFPIPQGSNEAKAALYTLMADGATDGAALRKFAHANKLKEVVV